MKIEKTLGVIIYSENYKELADWYENVLGFKAIEHLELPDDTYVAFEMGDNYFSVGQHSEVHGKNQDSCRIMINFNVPSVAETYEEIKDKDVKVVAPPFEAPPGGFYCMTLKDPEGNIIQFFSVEK